MVLYFSPTAHVKGSNDWLIYMGRDKYENEELIKYGWPEDVWFHVDKLSSAHVYLRLPHGKTLDDIPAGLLEECCQLVKQNSIQGCKENNVDIVYTKWSNLKKTADMVVGQIGFHKQKEVRKFRIVKKNNEILNRIIKTKAEADPDLAAQREQYDKETSYVRKQALKKQWLEEEQIAEQKQQEAERRSYKNLLSEEAMTSNKDVMTNYASIEEAEDDFM